MTLKSVIFDLDGTLVQHSHVLLPARLAEWGHPREPARVDTVFSEQIEWFYARAQVLKEAGRTDLATFERLLGQLYRRVARQLEIRDDTVAARMQDFFAAQPTPPLFDDVLPTLTYLEANGWRTGIITQRGRLGSRRFLLEHGLLDRFPVLVAGDDGFGRKPAAGPFLRALELLASTPETAVYVGDRLDDDCVGACAVGLRTFLIDRTGRHRAASHAADWTHLTDLTDLTGHLIVLGRS